MTAAACATAACTRRRPVGTSHAKGSSDAGDIMIKALTVGSIKGELLMRRCFTRSPQRNHLPDDSKNNVRTRPYCLGVVHSFQS